MPNVQQILDGFAESAEATMQMCGSVEALKRDYLADYRGIVTRAELDAAHFMVCQEWARCKAELDADNG